MNCFLRRAPLRMVAMATIGSGLIYSNTASDSFRTSLQISAVPVPFRDTLQSSLMMIMQDMLPCPSFLSFDPSRYGGNVPFIFPKFASAESAPPAGIKKAAAASSSEVGDSTKPCCGCLSRDTIANAAARIGPAVVNLSVPRGYHGLGVGKSMGSGTIIDKNGTILTCAHVVVHSQNLTTSSKGKVEVTLQDGRTFEGTVVNADVHSDIAIVKINSKTPLPTAKLGSSKKLRPGEWVVAVGCPLSLQNTVTAGIISCVDRKSSDLGIGGMRREYLQTDCAINAGNSGGPLVNIDGEVIGVNIMKVAVADGLGFSVPIDAASKIIEQFETKGRVVRPWLGLKMLDLNDMIIAQLKERDPAFPSVSKGVLVPVVIPGSPADRSGFCPGDVVVEFDGSPVQSINEITDILGDKVGKPLKVVVRRSNDISATLTVIAEEANPDM